MLNREQMIEEIQKKIGSYIQHGGAIEGGGWKVYDPISISRVLSTLNKDHRVKYHPFAQEIYIDDWGSGFLFISRKLLNEDNSDAMLNDQSDETIQSIYKILCK